MQNDRKWFLMHYIKEWYTADLYKAIIIINYKGQCESYQGHLQFVSNGWIIVLNLLFNFFFTEINEGFSSFLIILQQ